MVPMNLVMGDGGDKPLVLTEPQKAKVKPITALDAQLGRIRAATVDDRLGLSPAPRANGLRLLCVSGHRQPAWHIQQVGKGLLVAGIGVNAEWLVDWSRGLDRAWEHDEFAIHSWDLGRGGSG
jgi:hypothetical protein